MTQTQCTQELKQIEQEHQHLHQKSTYTATARFLVFLLILFGIYLGYDKQLAYGYIISIISLILFIILFLYHQGIKDRIHYMNCRKEVIEHMYMRYEKTWNTFEDNGDEFETSHVSEDLDLLGTASLYQYISSAATTLGRRKLKDALLHGSMDEATIRRRQQAVKEFYERSDFNIHMQTLSRKIMHDAPIKEEVMEQILTKLEADVKHIPPFWNACSIIMPLFMLISLGGAILNLLPGGYAWICFIVSIILSLLYKAQADEELSTLFVLSRGMRTYEEIFDALEKEPLKSEELLYFKDQIKLANVGLKKMSSFIGFVNVRLNAITYMIASGLILVDLQLVKVYQKWRKHYGKLVREWMQAAGNCEVYASLSNLANAKEQFCFPDVLKQDHPYLSFRDIRHPLIKETICVANTYEIKNGTCIITGSNMSGKTTFMRSIGVNLALAMAGAPVCASSFQFTPMRLYTSMRVVDDVEHGISTFYGEILRIKEMMEAGQKEEKMMVLIDEIFKGTNSADRIIGAKEAIQRLQKPWILSFVTTHDFELCELEYVDNLNISNMHFSEYYEHDEIHFDYTIKKGRCQTTNARELMKMAGIIS